MDPDERGNASPSAADETLARHQAFARVLSGEKAMGWDEWVMFVHKSRCLTEEGRTVATWAVSILRSALGTDLLERVEKRKEDHPILSIGMWPLANDAPWVYANLFQIAAQLEILRRENRLVRKSMRDNLQALNWVHALLQLEVAGFGVRAGWNSTFEPELGNGRRGDVRLEKGPSALLVETTSMRMSDEELKILNAAHAVSWRIQAIKFEHDVQIIGDIGDVLSEEAVAECLRAVEAAATATAADGQDRHVHTLAGGHLNIRLDRHATDQLNVSGPVVQTDVWSRFRARLNDKSNQMAGSGKQAWVRLEDWAGIWQFTPLRSMTLSEKLATLAPFLHSALQPHPNLAGIVLAPPLF